MSKPIVDSVDKYHLVDAHTPPETHHLLVEAGEAKAHLPWTDLILKSLLGGAFIALGAAFDITVVGGSPGLRSTDPALATLIGAFLFPVGFTFIIITNVELATSNFYTMMFSTLQRRTTIYDLARNWIVSYVFNTAGALFFAGILTWWSDTLSSDAQSTYAVTQAEGRVNVNWAYNFTRGIGCNWLVGLAMYLATSGRDNTSKIYGLWIPIWAFVGLGYQHSVANYFLVPVGMFYGTNFGVGKFIWNCCIPVTLGNIVGGAFFCGFLFWLLYGREPTLVNEAGTQLGGDKRPGRNRHGDASISDTTLDGHSQPRVEGNAV